MTPPAPLCDCPAGSCRWGCSPTFQARCQGVDPTIPPELRIAAAYQLRARCHGQALPAMLTRPSVDPTDLAIERAAERAAELRAAESSRCRHRGDTPIRSAPCSCPVIATLPIYQCHCPALRKDASDDPRECSDLRQPAPPAIYCGTCPAHSERPGNPLQKQKWFATGATLNNGIS